jgi:hypothetical protein
MKKNYNTIAITILLFILSPALLRAQCTTPTTVPYYEGFSSLSFSNQLPTCWSASNPSVTCLTFTTPNNYAAFYFNPGGVSYFYSRGIQLYAGISYSASMFYKTDNTLGTNWSNLAILRGTTQSPTGLVQIASTSGAASSAAYIPLSNTFAVPVSGGYYFAIRATGINSGTSPYLYWDDLAVTIPCGPGSGNSDQAPAQLSGTICSTESGTISVATPGPYIYLWSTGATTPTIAVFPGQNTNYTVTLTNTITACANTYIYQLTVNPTPTIMAIAGSTIVCAGSTVVITGYGANTYAWSNGGIGPSITVTPTSEMTYSMIGTNSLGCSAVTIATVMVKPLPNLSVTSTAFTICENEQVSLNVSGAVSYTWNYSGGPSNNASITVSPLQSSIFIASGTGTNGCVSQKTVSVQVNDCTGLNQVTTTTTLKISPNPNEGNFTIEGALNSSFTIYDLLGRVTRQGIIESEKYSIQMIGLPAGVYLVKIDGDKDSKSLKTLKE